MDNSIITNNNANNIAKVIYRAYLKYGKGII